MKSQDKSNKDKSVQLDAVQRELDDIKKQECHLSEQVHRFKNELNDVSLVKIRRMKDEEFSLRFYLLLL